MYEFAIRCQQSESMLEKILKFQEKEEISEDNERSEINVDFSVISNNNIKNDTSTLISNNINLKNNKEQSLDEPDETLCSENKPEASFSVKTDSEEITEVTNQKCDKTSELETPKTKRHKSKRSASLPKELRDHIIQVKRPRSRNHVCSVCNKAFSYSHLLLHMRTHTNEKPYECNICQSRFSLNCNLKRHMMIHTGEKPYKCDVCGKGN